MRARSGASMRRTAAPAERRHAQGCHLGHGGRMRSSLLRMHCSRGGTRAHESAFPFLPPCSPKLPARAVPLGCVLCARGRGGAAACLAGPARSLLAAVGHADARPPSHVSETLSGVCLDLMGGFRVGARSVMQDIRYDSATQFASAYYLTVTPLG